MNLQHLKYFYDSVKFSSITEAADANFVGQSAVSKAIRSLEEDLEAKLLIHRRNQFLLTEKGQQVFLKAGGVFESIENLKDFQNSPEEIKGEVRFACQSSIAESPFLGETFLALQNKFPDVELKLRLGRTDLVRTWLKNREVDFALTVNNRNFSEFDSKFVLGGSFHLYKSKNYRARWRTEGVILTEPTLEVENIKALYREKMGSALPVKFEIGSWSAIKNFVLQGLGVGLLPDYITRDEVRRRRLKIVAAKTLSTPYEIIQITNKNSFLQKRVKVVMDELASQAQPSC